MLLAVIGVCQVVGQNLDEDQDNDSLGALYQDNPYDTPNGDKFEEYATTQDPASAEHNER
jgi:hypothetical protein